MGIAATVSFPYRDKDGEFLVHATVYPNGIVRLDGIDTDDGNDCDIEDWTSSEQSVMKGLARKAATQLEEDEDDADDEADIQNEEGNWR